MIHPIAELKHWWWRRTLRNREVTIISENCWGGFMCQFTGMRYNSPFVGLLVPAPDYIKILRSLREYVEGTLHEIAWEESRYAENLKRFNFRFPLAVLTRRMEVIPWRFTSATAKPSRRRLPSGIVEPSA